MNAPNCYSFNDMKRLTRGKFKAMNSELIGKKNGGFYLTVDPACIAEKLDHDIFLERLKDLKMKEVFRLLGDGYKNSEVRKELGLSQYEFKKIHKETCYCFSQYLGLV